MALPHIQNSLAGREKYDPVFRQIFELDIDLPKALVAEFGGNRALISEHVLSVSGLEALDRVPETDVQKFMGTNRTYVKPHVDDTTAEISVKLSLNLRNGTDNYIYKLFRAWARLGYNIETGERHLKKDYCADWLKVRVANVAGDVWREVVFHDVMIAGAIAGQGEELNYTEDGICELEVKFKSDWWKEILA